MKKSHFSLKNTFSRKLSSSRLYDDPLLALAHFQNKLNRKIEESGFSECLHNALQIFIEHFHFKNAILFVGSDLLVSTLSDAFYGDIAPQLLNILDENEHVYVESIKFKNGTKHKYVLIFRNNDKLYAFFDTTEHNFEVLKKLYNIVIPTCLHTISTFILLPGKLDGEKGLNVKKIPTHLSIDKKKLKVRYATSNCHLLFQQNKLGKEKKLEGHRITNFIENSKESVTDFLSSDIKRQVWFVKEGHQLLVTKTGNGEKNECELDIFLIEENDEVEASENNNGEMDDFMGHVSHEIRTPLNGIITMLSILSTTDLDEKQKKLLEILQYSSYSLMTLINDMLDIGKLNRDKMFLRESEISLNSIIGAIYISAAEEARKKGIFLSKNVQSDLPENIYADSIRIRQILLNLLGNAIKFTNQGTIQIDVNFKTLNKSRALFLISVSDTGIGIDKSNHEVIFEPYRQVDQSLTKQYEGCGLGLSISRKLARLMPNGDILLESEPNKGSKFTLRFEASIINSNILFEEFEGKLKGLSALVVDDMPESRLFLFKLFEEWGIETTATGSAMEVEKMYLPQIHKYDFIVVDFRMPVKDGVSLGRLIKEHSPQTPLILTSSSDNTVIDTSIFIGCLLKPFTEVSLFAMILKSQGVMSDQIKAILEKKMSKKIQRFDKHYNAKNKSILVVEDIEMNRKVMLTLLESLGYAKITMVENGEEMLEKCLDARNKFHMILLDMKMPKKDGYQASKELSETYTERRIQRPKILAITALNNSRKLQTWQQMGYIDGVVPKPVDMHILKMKMEQKLNKSRPLGRFSNAV